MATRPKSEAKSPPTDARGKIVDALMELAAETRFEDISIRDICTAAAVSLADFRDAFPSKGAVLAGFSRRIDRAVLAHDTGELADENPRERLFDVLMRRLEAMTPYREGVREAIAWLRREPVAALAMNQVSTNSMRFMLEAAGIEARGAAGGVMAELDRMLTRGERAVAGLDRVSALTSPFSALVQAAFEAGRRARRGGSRPARKDDPGDEDVTAL